MPTIRRIITGLAVGTTLAGGLVSLGAITSATAANAGVTGAFGDSSFADGRFNDGLANLAGLQLLGLFSRTGAIDAHNADFSRTFINSFDRQTAIQPIRQQNDD